MAAFPPRPMEEITTPDLRDMNRLDELDPDISATLTDFLTYTEHLPSAVIRSMALISEQDRITVKWQQDIHNLLTSYGSLPRQIEQSVGNGTSPSSPKHDVPDSLTLRAQISSANASLQRARRLAAAESYRLADMVSRDRTRLQLITRKLKSLPMPPSRDPSPSSSAVVTSPNVSNSLQRSVPKVSGSTARLKSVQVIVPGEVLPPLDQSTIFESDVSDSDDDEDQSPVRPAKSRKERLKLGLRHPASRPPKPPKPATTPKRPDISTSSALMALVPPPDDAKPGSIWKPWKRITEFELAKLRKRMKKNAIWWPSPAMRNRELKNLGRGADAMDEAKARAEAGGEPFLDECTSDWKDPTRAVLSDLNKIDSDTILTSETARIAFDNDEDDTLINRGMRLNEAKKRKRERELEEQAADSVAADEPPSQQPMPVSVSEKAPTPMQVDLPHAANEVPAEIEPAVEGEIEAEDSEPTKIEQRSPDIPTVSNKVDHDMPNDDQRNDDQRNDDQRSHVEQDGTLHTLLTIADDQKKTNGVSSEDTTDPAVTEPNVSEKNPPALGNAELGEQKAASPARSSPARSSPRKRKREITPLQTDAKPTQDSPDPLANTLPRPKRLRVSLPAPHKTPSIEPSVPQKASEEKAAGSEEADKDDLASSPISPVPKIFKKTPTPAPPTPVRPSRKSESVLPERKTRLSLKQSKAASAEPPLQSRRTSLRRASNISLPGPTKASTPSATPTTPATGSTTRGLRRRPNPGFVTNVNEQGKAQISVGRRRNKPKRKRKSYAKKAVSMRNGTHPKDDKTDDNQHDDDDEEGNEDEDDDDEDDDDDIDPDEPRYCTCNGVSEGSMIACDNDKCEGGEWFHLECIGLVEIPGRRDKYFCPACRVKLPGKIPANGIVRA